ncbi:flagellar FlbD family protein [Silvibacterium sp.]|uniref:flagellar FlbD family protein n=1 Tax=Silvibacterium sp. TaxID=1964179 RepID=UPI0039E708FB
MIALTRLNGSRFVLNSDLIQTIESSPDTTVTLMSGDKMLVREGVDEVKELTLAFRARLIADAARQSPEGLVIATGQLWHESPAASLGIAARRAPHSLPDIDSDFESDRDSDLDSDLDRPL